MSALPGGTVLNGARSIAPREPSLQLAEQCSALQSKGARQDSSLSREREAVIAGGMGVEFFFPELVEPAAGCGSGV